MILEYGTRIAVSSDGYPGEYGNHIHCRWRFRGPADSVIIVKFNDFQLDVQGDKLTVGKYNIFILVNELVLTCASNKNIRSNGCIPPSSIPRLGGSINGDKRFHDATAKT